jgi:putative membrane protein
MLSQLTDQASAVSQVWAWHPHFEVWVLVIGLVGAWIYMTRVIGPIAVAATPRSVADRHAASRSAASSAAMLMFWLAADWPLHDLAEEYLYSAHMLQHMMMSYFLAPLVLLSTPEWMARALLGQDRVYRASAVPHATRGARV